MRACTGLNQSIEALTTSGEFEHIPVWIDSRAGSSVATSPIAGRLASLWTYNKSPGGEGAVPTTVAIPDNTTRGGLLQTDAGGGREKWLLGAEAASVTAGTLIVYDRLLHIGSLSGTTTTAQTVGGTLTRNTGGVGNQIWVEIYGIIGTTGTTITASYTNQAGTSGRTSKAASIGATNNREVTRIIPIPLADGDTGVQAVASVTVLATTGTAGNFGVTIARPLMTMPMPVSGCGTVRDLIAGLPSIRAIDTDACLALAWYAGTTTAPQIFANFHFAEI